MLVGARENQMIINGIAYCDRCWTARSSETADDGSLCACLLDAAAIKSCEDCSNSKTPCAFCNPIHHANHQIAMAELDKILEEYKKDEHPELCPACQNKGDHPCEACGYRLEGDEAEDENEYYDREYDD